MTSAARSARLPAAPLLIRAGWVAWGAFVAIVVALALAGDGRSLIGFYADAAL